MSSITVTQAAKDLGIDEETYRLTLEQFLPNDYGIVSLIDTDVASLVAATIDAHVSGKSLPPASTNSSLSVAEQSNIINGTNEVLTTFWDATTLDSSQISVALAKITAIKDKQIFDETYQKVFSDGINQTLQNRADTVVKLAQQLSVPQKPLGFTRANIQNQLDEIDKIIQGLNS